jgi:hypothetical protein
MLTVQVRVMGKHSKFWRWWLLSRNASEAMVEYGGVWSQAVGLVLVPLSDIWIQPPRRNFHVQFISYKNCWYLQRQCCNKLYYCLTQKLFIPGNSDGTHYASNCCWHVRENRILEGRFWVEKGTTYLMNTLHRKTAREEHSMLRIW